MKKIRLIFGKNQVRTGFTLIELLVVVLIIGILAAVAVPEYQYAVRKARVSALIPMLRAIKDANVRYYLANGSYSPDPASWDIDFPAGTRFSVGPKSATITLPDGSVFVAVSAPQEGIAWPRVTASPGLASSNQIWTAYEGNRWRCYGTDDIGKRVCKTYGCSVTDVSNGCDFTM